MQNRSLAVCCVLICTFVLLIFLMASSPAYAGETEALLNLLLKRGLITEQEYEELIARSKEETERQKEVATQKEASAGTERSDRVTFEGAIEGEYRWMKHREVTAGNNDSTSDLYLRTIELDIGVKLTDWIVASAVLNSEWIGDDVNVGARYSFYNDETSGRNAFLSVEYRRTGLRVDSPADMEKDDDEIYARMGVNF